MPNHDDLTKQTNYLQCKKLALMSDDNPLKKDKEGHCPLSSQNSCPQIKTGQFFVFRKFFADRQVQET